MIDVTTAGDDGHWDHADIKRLCEYRDALKAELAESKEREQWLCGRLDVENEECQTLEARIAALEAGLRWYADNMGESKSRDMRIIVQDAGKRARDALGSSAVPSAYKAEKSSEP